MATLCEQFQELLDDLCGNTLRDNQKNVKIVRLSNDELKQFGMHRQECDECRVALETIGFLEYFGLPEEHAKRIIDALYPEGYDW